MYQPIFSIVKRELNRIFTDKRMVFSLFLLPGLSIALIYIVMGYVSMTFMNDIDAHTSSYVVNNAPESFISYVDEKADKASLRITFVKDKGIAQYAEAIYTGNLDMYLSFNEDFENKLKRQEKTLVSTYYNYGEDYSTEAYNKMVNTVLMGYKNQLLSLRFNNPYAYEIFDIEDKSQIASVVDEAKVSGKMLASIVPMMISIFLFAGAMSIVIESIAGEKERGTLATLLMTPVKRSHIAMGKMAGHMLIATLSALSSLLGIAITFMAVVWMMPEVINLGGNIDYSIVDWLALGSIMLMIVGCYVGVISVLSAISKTVKEASTYITPVYMGVMVLSFMNMFNFSAPPIWQFAIPVYGHILGLKSLFLHQLTSLNMVFITGNTLLTWSFFIWLIGRMFNNEKMIFSS